MKRITLFWADKFRELVNKNLDKNFTLPEIHLISEYLRFCDEYEKKLRKRLK